MEIETLYYYLKVSETLNFRKAAEELFISQSTLSRSISLLEKELGVTLLARTTRTVTLTEAGRECIDAVNKIIDDYENLKLKAMGFAGNITGKISIGFFGNDTAYFISRIYENVRKHYPSIQIEISDRPIPQLEEMLNNDEYDALILLKPCISSEKNIIKKTISHEIPSVVMKDSHPLAKRKIINIKELKDEKIILLSPSKIHSVHDELVKLCRESGFEPDISTSKGFNTTLNVATDKGILLSPFYNGDYGLIPGLVRIPVKCDDRFDRQLIYKKNNSNKMMPFFISVIDNMIKQNIFST